MFMDSKVERLFAVGVFCIGLIGFAYAAGPQVIKISSDILECSVTNGVLNISQRSRVISNQNNYALEITSFTLSTKESQISVSTSESSSFFL